jgi:hypothetical protein
MAETTITNAAKPQQRADEFGALLEVEPISWPVASPRQHRQVVAAWEACGFIIRVVEGLEGNEEERHAEVKQWRAKHGTLPGVLGALIPGIVAQLEQGGKLLAETLDCLKRLQAYFEAAETTARVLGDLATMEAIAAGELPPEE